MPRIERKRPPVYSEGCFLLGGLRLASELARVGAAMFDKEGSLW